ncbi:methyltransferase domain-containing protein [Glaciecola sp. MF2-115]|uniref:methyltransferase domain-containing protein n=1 Tax=Glaciecola sp. MF2-115 TaxID=3384827 RepID=UPI0039A019AE
MTDYPPSTKYYNEHIAEISQQYLSVSFDDVHGPWSKFLPTILNKSNASVLDVGAGSGRDISHLYSYASSCLGEESKLGNFVAIEPTEKLREVGQQHTKDQNIKWINDSLPALQKTHSLEVSFDLILLCAVWMHIPVSQRERALRKLTNLLKPGGIIVMTLKQGMSKQEQQERAMYDVSVGEIERFALELGLVCELMPQTSQDALNREGVFWETLVLKFPDDGTGSFPLIRHVALNDGKSATHKLGLLRVLLRIADGHAGAVLRREKTLSGERVILPIGLVALYWIHQYKDLIDQHGLFQTPASSPNMGFMKQDGWHCLKKYRSSDFRVGNLFVGDDAIALHRTISQCAQNILKMPCKYITLPNTDKQVFEASIKTVRAKQSLFLDLQSLKKWGELSVPESTWLAMTRYACWIEPVLVSEWAKTMESYKGNQNYSNSQNKLTMLAALDWEAPKRSTQHVRDRFDQLIGAHSMQCVWSAKSLRKKYDIDHGMPFSRWPNNDLWNLLPSDIKVNNEKRDKLPSAQTLKQSKSRMQEWWMMAWLNDNESKEKQRFFAEANLALPGLSHDNQSIDDVFEALGLQRGRLRDLQQLREW